MSYLEIWNEIVEWISGNRLVPESIVQSEWEDYFADAEYFGYSKKKGEIDNKRSIPLGSVKRVIPDIIMRKDNKDLFVIELKQLCKSFEERFREQLFSYLKQLQLNIGVLVCQNIYVYVFKGNDDYSYIKIPFEKNSQDGAKFVELFSKGNYDSEKIKEFISNKTNRDKNIKEIKELISDEYLIDLIKKDLASGYASDEIEESLKGFNIRAEKKGKPEAVQAYNGGYGIAKFAKGQRCGISVSPTSKDDPYNKLKALRLVYGLREEGKLTDEMLSGFLDRHKTNRNFKLSRKLLTDDPNDICDVGGNPRYYPKDPIDINGTKYWICSQWARFTKPYRDKFAQEHGIDLESTKYDHCF